MTHRSTQSATLPIHAEGMRVGLAVSRYHSDITGPMCRAAVELFHRSGGREGDLIMIEVPGAFELIAACRALAEREDVDAIVAIGCVIRGETKHDRAIVSAVANGLSAIIVESGMPIGFGVLTCDTEAQARQRAGGSKGNKGEEAMHAAIATATAIHALARDEELA